MKIVNPEARDRAQARGIAAKPPKRMNEMNA
jgi:hypothetical protein